MDRVKQDLQDYSDKLDSMSQKLKQDEMESKKRVQAKEAEINQKL